MNICIYIYNINKFKFISKFVIKTYLIIQKILDILIVIVIKYMYQVYPY